MNSLITTVLAAVSFSFSFAGQSLTTLKSKSTEIPKIHAAIHANKGTDFKAYLSKDDINIHDKHGYTPLMRALFEKKPHIAREILRHSPDINALDNKGCTAVMHAVRSKQHALLSELVARGADLNVVSNSGDNAFFQAKRSQHNEPIQTLIRLGVNNMDDEQCTCERICGFSEQLKNERLPIITAALKNYRNSARHCFPDDLLIIIGNYVQ
jgi:ankyrin repeat protein